MQLWKYILHSFKWLLFTWLLFIYNVTFYAGFSRENSEGLTQCLSGVVSTTLEHQARHMVTKPQQVCVLVVMLKHFVELFKINNNNNRPQNNNNNIWQPITNKKLKYVVVVLDPQNNIIFILIIRKWVLLYVSSHRQDNTYHSLCCTSHQALAGMRNSTMKDRSGEHSYLRATSRSPINNKWQAKI